MFILKHSDVMNLDGTEVNRAALSADFDTVTTQINHMVGKMSASPRDASTADLPAYDVGKFKLPVLRERPGLEVPSFVGLRMVAIERALDDTLREHEDYRAGLLADAEPGTSGPPMDATQYAFVIGRMHLVWVPAMSSPSLNDWLRWIVGQEPSAGEKVAAGDEQKLRWKGGLRFPRPSPSHESTANLPETAGRPTVTTH